MMFNNPSKKELYEENKKLRNLLNDIWHMLDECKLDFRNGVVASCGTDEGYVQGWKLYHQLEEEITPYLDITMGGRDGKPG